MGVETTPVRRPVRLIIWLVVVLLLVGLAYLGQLTSDEQPEDVAYRFSTTIWGGLFYGVVVGLLLLISWGLPRRQLFALARPASWPRALGLTLLTLLAIFCVSFALSPVLNADEEQGLLPEEWDSSRAGAFVAFFALVALAAPVVEELTYRGLGFGLLAPYGAWLAILVTGLLFGLAHGLFLALPVLAFFGIATGWLRWRTGSVYPSMLLHAVFNGTALVVSVAA